MCRATPPWQCCRTICRHASLFAINLIACCAAQIQVHACLAVQLYISTLSCLVLAHLMPLPKSCLLYTPATGKLYHNTCSKKYLSCAMCLQIMTALRELDLSGCLHLWGLPSTLGQLSNLEVLRVKCSANWMMRHLPDSIGELSNLQILDLTGCRKILTLPSSLAFLGSLQMLNLGSCTSLQALQDTMGQLTSLTKLNLSCCRGLTRLPTFLGALTNLQLLHLGGCRRLNVSCDTLREVSGVTWNDLGEGKFKPLFEGPGRV